MENNITTDKQLVSSIRNTEWIDLSPGHKDLRLSIEDYIKSSCVDKNDTSPIMVKGAFGIGKTATLHYMFHFAWTILSIPTFLINLEDIIIAIRRYNKENGIDKIPNKSVSKVIGKILSEQINILLNQPPENILGEQIYFPSFDKDNLNQYLSRFSIAKIHTTNNGEFEDSELPKFDYEVIKKGVNSENRYLLLIDEFEAKYHELRDLIESSGGGPLRQFFDDVSYISSTNYYCIVGNGPASGYEFGGNAAEQRRLIVKQIQMPTVSTLMKSFLKGYDKKYVNLLWWLSRARPGQIKLLKASLQEYQLNKENNYNRFIRNNDVLKNDIDETGESNVKFLKSEVFNEYNSSLQKQIKDSLLCLAPRLIDIPEENTKDMLLEGKELFSASSSKLKYDELIDALKKDFSKQEIYDKIESEKIYSYLDLILESISDEENNICFGCLDRDNINKAFVDSFLNPLFSLLYDMISIYEDENDLEIKKLLDFLLAQNIKSENVQNINITFRNSYNIYEVDQQNQDKIYLQLNLNTIREAIEQPIGSPKLPYKSESIESKILEIEEFKNIFHWGGSSKEEIIFIPDYNNESLLQSYVDNLQEYFQNNWTKNKNYFSNGELITSIVYLKESDIITKFKEWLSKDGDNNDELPIRLKKLDVLNIDHFHIHNTQRICDFISSLLRIATIGIHNNEIIIKDIQNQSSDDEILIRIEKIIDVILDGKWTESKQTRRTIEYYKDLLLTGKNSAINNLLFLARNDHLNQIKTFLPNLENIKNDLLKISIEDGIFDEAYSTKSKNLFNFLLAELDAKDPSLISILKSCREFKFKPSLENKDQDVSLVDIFYCFQKNPKIERCIEDYKSPNLAKDLSRFSDLLAEYIKVDSLDELSNIISQEQSTISTYSKSLNFYTSNIPYLEGLFYLSISKQLEYNDLFEESILVLKSTQKDFEGIFTELTDSLFELKELTLTDNELSYNSEIRSFITSLIQPLVRLLEENTKISYLLITDEILEYLRITLSNVKKFKSQVESIVIKMNGHKTKINEKQVKYDELFEKSSIHQKLISSRKTKDFFYKEKYGKSFKFDNSFNAIFGDINKYKPSDKFKIEDNELSQFIANVDRSFSEKMKDIESEIVETIAIDGQIDTVLNLEKSIRELLNTDEHE